MANLFIAIAKMKKSSKINISFEIHAWKDGFYTIDLTNAENTVE